jgi:hypothetical protein
VEDFKATQVVSRLLTGLSAEQRARYDEIAALARATANRLPRPMEKSSEPGHAFSLHTARVL